uniref:Uncharacterized protein n=1 Tax=Caenorhabditis japonica TaxID=281687 RepID=A0A8R1EIJ9_CAEJA
MDAEAPGLVSMAQSGVKVGQTSYRYMTTRRRMAKVFAFICYTIQVGAVSAVSETNSNTHKIEEMVQMEEVVDAAADDELPVVSSTLNQITVQIEPPTPSASTRTSYSNQGYIV